VRDDTASARHRLYLLARVIVARHYRRQLTLAEVAQALSSSPRALQRAYAQFGHTSFREDLLARRMSVAADLLIEQCAIAVADVGRLVGYRHGSHFAAAFQRRFGLSPARFREAAAAGSVNAPQALPEGGGPAAAMAFSPAGPPAPSPVGSIGSAPGSRRRISVPPPGAGSAVTLPPCCRAT
jgi:AraC-like DNA-binding protein